jgi:hypothetical protein
LLLASVKSAIASSIELTFLAVLAFAAAPQTIRAGPPYVTDDPEPVDYRNWEVIMSLQGFHDVGGWTGAAPFVEINYGAVPEIQLHIGGSLAVASASSGTARFGYGDTELGVKYRFVDETPAHPQIAFYPLLEVPTGDSSRGLGSGSVDALLPFWLEKNIGPWTTYGGGGYWINPGTGNKNWEFLGWLLQRRLTSHLTLGGEIFYETARVVGGPSNTLVNLGGSIDFSDTYHLLFSAGHSIQGPSNFLCFFGLQITFGPQKTTK